MNYADWYTDSVEVRRVQNVKVGGLTRKERVTVFENVPCRIYRSNDKPLATTQTASDVKQDAKLALANGWDIRAGDELLITRGGILGKSGPVERYFAGTPQAYYEPFGAVIPGLAHQEIVLMQEERA